jgi:hypothetical protein
MDAGSGSRGVHYGDSSRDRRNAGHSPTPILKRSTSGLDASGRGMRAIKEDVTAVDEESYLSRSGGYGGLVHSRSKDAFEDSVREPNRPPAVIPGLTTFMQEAYREKYGIFCDSAQSLLTFWKEHVSSFYRSRAETMRATKEAVSGWSAASPGHTGSR